MKFLILFTAFLAVACARRIELDNLQNKLIQLKDNGDSSKEVKEIVNELKTQLKEVSREVGEKLCNLKGTEVYDAVTKSIECAEISSVGDGLICETYEATFKKCIEPVEKLFSTCVASQYRDVPKFIVSVLTSTSEYLCNARVKEVVELVNPCQIKGSDNIQKCLKSVGSISDRLDKITNIKEEICKDMKDAKTCVLDELNKHCKNEVTRKSFADLYEAAVIKPCK